MTSFAVLGATGQTGNSILQVLLAEQQASSINVLVRSRAKLERMTPQLAAGRGDNDNKIPPVRIHEGVISDVPLLTECIRGTTAVFLTVATPDNRPHVRVARDQAEAVVAALERLRAEAAAAGAGGGTAKLPTLVMLSSSETEERLVLGIPWPVRRLLFLCNYWVYTDLMAAERYLRDRADWVDAVFFKPGGISHDARRGHLLSTDTSMTFVSFLDVAGGMVECGIDGERWSGRSVSVLSKSKAKVPLESFVLLARNLLGTFFPRLYLRLF